MRLIGRKNCAPALVTLFVAVVLISSGARSFLFVLPAVVMGLGGIAIGMVTYRGLSRFTGGDFSRPGSAFLAGFLAWIFGILCSLVVNDIIVLRDASPLPPYGDMMPELVFAARNGLVTGVEGIIFGAGLGQGRER